MTSSVETFQISLQAAEAYEANFVPALFADWAPHIVDAAAVRPGDAVLDVACGTGAVTRVAAERAGARGRTVGLDLNEGMLTVAMRLEPGIEWVQADAAALPFGTDTFDVVLSQAALMFFPDPGRALAEMARVLRPRGTVAIQVWASRDAQPGFKPAYEVLTRHAGPDAVDLVSAYWLMGDLARLTALLAEAGLEVTSTVTRTGAMLFGSIDEYVASEVEGTPLIDRISDETYRRIRKDAHDALLPYYTEAGGFRMPIVGHILTATPRAS